jgi:hypothetical protein
MKGGLIQYAKYIPYHHHIQGVKANKTPLEFDSLVVK